MAENEDIAAVSMATAPNDDAIVKRNAPNADLSAEVRHEIISKLMISKVEGEGKLCPGAMTRIASEVGVSTKSVYRI